MVIKYQNTQYDIAENLKTLLQRIFGKFSFLEQFAPLFLNVFWSLNEDLIEIDPDTRHETQQKKEGEDDRKERAESHCLITIKARFIGTKRVLLQKT